MTEHRAPSRRDVRYPLRRGTGGIDFVHPVSGRQCSAELTLLCIAGLAFVLKPEMEEIPAGSSLLGATLQIGACVLEGDVLIKSAGSSTDGELTLGGLFYPAGRDFEQRLEGIVAGLDAGGGEA